MKSLLTGLLICFCLNNLHAQDNDMISIGKMVTIHSETLDEDREIWIHVPNGNYENAINRKKYPVLYLLDGNAHFYSVVGMIKRLSSANNNTVCPEMIVVAILNTNRTRDLSPTMVDSVSAKLGEPNKFMSFIERELMPYIDSNYPTESYRMLIGHSLGGLTVINTLLEQPELFNAYVAIDPSIWWNDKNLLLKMKQQTLKKNYNTKSLFLGYANTMPKNMELSRVKRDTSYNTRHIRAILELDDLLQNNSLHNLSYKSKYYPEESHGSVPLITEYDALHFIFDYYPLEIRNDDILKPNSTILEKLNKRSQRLSKAYGREIKPERRIIERIAYTYMDDDQLDKAEEFFILNTINYPTDFSVFNTLGYFYIAIDNRKKAIQTFKKSLTINEDSDAKEQLKVLLKQ